MTTAVLLKSKGNFAKATHEDFVVDALAAVAFLRQRKEIDAKRIGLVGHSEGGIVAPLAAKDSPDIAFIVLLAGVGVPLEDLLIRQAGDIMRVVGASADFIAKTLATQRRSYRVLIEETNDEIAKTKMREIATQQLAEMTEEERKTIGLDPGDDRRATSHGANAMVSKAARLRSASGTAGGAMSGSRVERG